MSLPSITEEFVCSPGCDICLGSGTVCEAHPMRAWGESVCDERDLLASLFRLNGNSPCWCGAPGQPCEHAKGRCDCA